MCLHDAAPIELQMCCQCPARSSFEDIGDRPKLRSSLTCYARLEIDGSSHFPSMIGVRRQHRLSIQDISLNPVVQAAQTSAKHCLCCVYTPVMHPKILLASRRGILDVTSIVPVLQLNILHYNSCLLEVRYEEEASHAFLLPERSLWTKFTG